jgi:TatD DNase family protein
MELAASVEEVARSGILAAIGEAGFDFFGDRPERVRNDENERAQREAFEFQLQLATDLGLPLLVHARKATDLLFEYARALRGPPSVVFHSWSGNEAEAKALLRRGVNAFFSFGTTILNGHKRAMEACRALPDGTLLAETDAPWQPPRGRDFCRFEHLDLVLDGMAALRGEPREEVEERVALSFARAYPVARKEAPPG